MDTKIEKILDDIYALDASLKERDAEVRALVSELIALRPEATLDSAFAQALRERLFAERAVPAPIPTHAEPSIWWWLLRAAPLGAIALLVFMILPETPPQYTDVPPVTSPIMDTMSEDAVEADAPTMNQRSIKAPTGASGGGMADDTMMTMQAPDEATIPQRATLMGETLCLPHVDPTLGTKECAFGLRTDTGAYYALEMNLMSQTPPVLRVGQRIMASGVVVSIEQLSTDHWQKYPIEGIFSITDSVYILDSQ